MLNILLPLAALLVVLFAALLIISLRHRKYGVVLILAGLIVLGISTANKFVYGGLVANPGVIWMDPDGVPYSDIYASQRDGFTRWQIGGGVITAVGAVWVIADVFRNRR